MRHTALYVKSFLVWCCLQTSNMQTAVTSFSSARASFFTWSLLLFTWSLLLFTSPLFHSSLLRFLLPSPSVSPPSLSLQPWGIPLLITLHYSLPGDPRLHRVTEQSPNATRKKTTKPQRQLAQSGKYHHAPVHSISVWVPAGRLKLPLIVDPYRKNAQQNARGA